MTGTVTYGDTYTPADLYGPIANSTGYIFPGARSGVEPMLGLIGLVGRAKAGLGAWDGRVPVRIIKSHAETSCSCHGFAPEAHLVALEALMAAPVRVCACVEMHGPELAAAHAMTLLQALDTTSHSKPHMVCTGYFWTATMTGLEPGVMYSYQCGSPPPGELWTLLCPAAASRTFYGVSCCLAKHAMPILPDTARVMFRVSPPAADALQAVGGACSLRRRSRTLSPTRLPTKPRRSHTRPPPSHTRSRIRRHTRRRPSHMRRRPSLIRSRPRRQWRQRLTVSPASALCGRSWHRRPSTPPSTSSSCDSCSSFVRLSSASGGVSQPNVPCCIC